MTVDATRLASLEAVLFLADQPVPLPALATALETEEDEVRVLLDELVQRLRERQSGLVVRHVAGGYRLYTNPVADDAVERHLLAGRNGRLSNAALETLAVIAYKQPISRGDISDIRGVNADGAVRSLQSRGLVTEVGRDDGPGQAVLFGTTGTFLEQLGLVDLDELPPLTDYLDEVAPDEPVGEGLRRARKALAAGGRLPATGRGTWDGEVLDDDPEAAPTPVTSRGDFRDLTEDLERVAQAAMDRLRDAVTASEDPEAATAAMAAVAEDERAGPAVDDHGGDDWADTAPRGPVRGVTLVGEHDRSDGADEPGHVRPEADAAPAPADAAPADADDADSVEAVTPAVDDARAVRDGA